MKNGLSHEETFGWIWPVLLAVAWSGVVSYVELFWYPNHVRIYQLLQEGATVSKHLFYSFLGQTIGVGLGIVLALVFLLMTVRTCFRVRITPTPFSTSFKKWLSILILISCFSVALDTGTIVYRSLQVGVSFLGKSIGLLEQLDPIAIASILCCSAFSLGQKDAGWKDYGVWTFCFAIVALITSFGISIILYLYFKSFLCLMACVYLALWIRKGAKKDKEKRVFKKSCG